MSLSPRALTLVKKSDYFTHFNENQLKGILLWIIDEDYKIIDVTNSMADYYYLTREDMIGQSISKFTHPEGVAQIEKEHQWVLAVNEPVNTTLWVELPVGWRKFIVTQTPLDECYVIGVGHDMTNEDTKNRWLLKVDPECRRLRLGSRFNNQDLTLPELMVLHRLAWRRSHKAIANELSISLPTVSYRRDRIREKLGAETLDDMWEEIFISGLMHLLSLPLGSENMFLDYGHLLGLDSSTTAPVRKGI